MEGVGAYVSLNFFNCSDLHFQILDILISALAEYLQKVAQGDKKYPWISHHPSLKGNLLKTNMCGKTKYLKKHVDDVDYVDSQVLWTFKSVGEPE